MNVFVLVPFLAIIAFLSRPGSIAKNPFNGLALTTTESLVLQREIACLVMLALALTQLIPLPSWAELTQTGWISIVIIGIAVPIIAYMIASRQKPDPAYDVFRSLSPGTSLWVRYLISTILYMLLYEVLMRGIFLFFLLDMHSVPVAIAINVAVYTLMHLPKNRKEALLSIPTGLFLCWITVYTKSVWPAAMFHLSVALSFEILYSREPIHGTN